MWRQSASNLHAVASASLLLGRTWIFWNRQGVLRLGSKQLWSPSVIIFWLRVKEHQCLVMWCQNTWFRKIRYLQEEASSRINLRRRLSYRLNEAVIKLINNAWKRNCLNKWLFSFETRHLKRPFGDIKMWMKILKGFYRNPVAALNRSAMWKLCSQDNRRFFPLCK